MRHRHINPGVAGVSPALASVSLFPTKVFLVSIRKSCTSREKTTINIGRSESVFIFVCHKH